MGQPRIPMFSKVAPRIASGLRHQIASPTLLRPINRCFSAGSDMSQLQEVLNLREAMKTDTRKAMPFTEFEGLCAQHGIEDPSKLAAHFHQSGVALHFPNGPAGTDNAIFLDPEHAMQTMFGALSNESEAETKQEYANSLAAQQAEVAKQLAPLQEKQEQIELRSARSGKRVIWGSVFSVAGFMAGSAHLTWWVVSWDIMEPVTYHVGLTVALGGAIYAAVLPKEEFCYTSLADVFSNRRRRIDTARALEEGFSPTKLSELQQQASDLETKLAALGVAPIEAAEEKTEA